MNNFQQLGIVISWKCQNFPQKIFLRQVFMPFIALSQDFSIDDLSYKNRKRILTFQSIVYTTIRFTDIFLNIFNDPSFQFWLTSVGISIDKCGLQCGRIWNICKKNFWNFSTIFFLELDNFFKKVVSFSTQ